MLLTGCKLVAGMNPLTVKASQSLQQSPYPAFSQQTYSVLVVPAVCPKGCTSQQLQFHCQWRPAGSWQLHSCYLLRHDAIISAADTQDATSHNCQKLKSRFQHLKTLLLCVLRSPPGTSSNQHTDGKPPPQPGLQLNWFCAPCRPMFTYNELSGVQNIHPGGAAVGAGAVACSPCSPKGATGWSWRGLACNAT
jgi:hypothetical protein